jgi:hypothetical protein
MTNLERVQDIYDMIGKGQLLEAFDKYYHSDVNMEDVGENNLKQGKVACRAHEVNFLNAVAAFNGMGVESMTTSADGNTTAVESWMDLTFQGAPSNIVMKQVAVQKWQDGQIISEKFYHK